jgi:hypothetical protein
MAKNNKNSLLKQKQQTETLILQNSKINLMKRQLLFTLVRSDWTREHQQPFLSRLYMLCV